MYISVPLEMPLTLGWLAQAGPIADFPAPNIPVKDDLGFEGNYRPQSKGFNGFYAANWLLPAAQPFTPAAQRSACV
ncbi:hypothetical protein [Mesorhizobium sophorae]|uniref:hypothetical protein n=1 Tax=Mesorhizobium sophorae TaxID=1300294 RepID=UPI00117FB0CF|nr:hypothetical protein [Mesorhizobium sophorae]